MKRVVMLISAFVFILMLSACGDSDPVVDITDTVKPVISGIENKVIYVGDTIDLLDGVTASDDTDGDLTSSITIIGTVETTTPGNYSIVYSVTDSSGNTYEQTIIVTVLKSDAIKYPSVRELANSDFTELSLVQDEFVELQATLDISEVAYNGAVSISMTAGGTDWGGIYVIMNDPVDVSAYNAIHLVAQIPDNVASLTFKLEDGTNNFYINLLDYATGTDGDWTVFVVPTAVFTGVDFSTFKVIGFWNARDIDGNYTAATMLFDDLKFFNQVIGEDTTAPVISGAVDVTYYLNETVDLLAGISAVDNADGNVTSSISIDGTVDNTVVGVYPITYSVTDEAGNTASVTINITISEAPAAITLSDLINSDFTELNSVTDEMVALQVTEALSTTAYDGTNALSIEFPGTNWGGVYVTMVDPVDVSAYNAITLAAQIPSNVASMSFKLEDGTHNFYVNLLDYVTGTDGDWSLFTIPTSVFTDIDFSLLKTIGFWNTRDVDSVYTAATILIDNLKFVSVAYVSELLSSTMTEFDGNGGVFFGSNSGTVTTSTTALDGSFSIQLNFDGLSWGGMYAALDSAVDVSSYTNIVFSIQMNAAVESLVVKIEDGTNNNTVNIADYTPAVDGSWYTYTIPLADFPNVDFSLFKLIGFWHPKDVDGNYIACEIIFDNLYFN